MCVILLVRIVFLFVSTGHREDQTKGQGHHARDHAPGRLRCPHRKGCQGHIHR